MPRAQGGRLLAIYFAPMRPPNPGRRRMMVACLAAVVAMFVPAAVQPEAQTTLRVTVQQAKDAFEGFVDTARRE